MDSENINNNKNNNITNTNNTLKKRHIDEYGYEELDDQDLQNLEDFIFDCMSQFERDTGKKAISPSFVEKYPKPIKRVKDEEDYEFIPTATIITIPSLASSQLLNPSLNSSCGNFVLVSLPLPKEFEDKLILSQPSTSTSTSTSMSTTSTTTSSISS